VLGVSLVAKLLIFSIPASAENVHSSIESMFRNARWLEREASEMFGIFFREKSDRRALFTVPLFYNYPFRKKYPTSGLYELFFCVVMQRFF
jgi:NADH:ubiquinone oxidoreductase subunit C